MRLPRPSRRSRHSRGARWRDSSSGELIAALGAAALVVRTSEATLAALAFQVGQRSAPDLGPSGLAREQGFSSPGRMVAHATGGSLGDAAHLIDAGRVFAPSAMPDGAGPDGAGPTARIRTTRHPRRRSPNTRVSQHLWPQATSARRRPGWWAAPWTPWVSKPRPWRSGSCARARELDLSELRRVCQRLEASSDPVAWEAREQRQHEARYVSVSEDFEGMVLIQARLDPPSAAPVVAWLDAQVKDAFRRRRDGDPLDADTRTVGQIRADALVGLARHGMACDEPTSGVSTTVVVRIALDDLLNWHRRGRKRQPRRPAERGRDPRHRRRRRSHPGGAGCRIRSPRHGAGAATLHPGPTTRTRGARRRVRDVPRATVVLRGSPHQVVDNILAQRILTTACCFARRAITACTETAGTSNRRAARCGSRRQPPWTPLGRGGLAAGRGCSSPHS